MGGFVTTWAVLSLLIFPPTFGEFIRRLWRPAGQPFSSAAPVGAIGPDPFTLYQPATPTAVIPPAATGISPPPADAPPPAASPAQPTDAVSMPMTAVPSMPTATLGHAGASIVVTQPASAPVSPAVAPADVPTLIPALQTVTTATAIVEGSLTSPTTYTARVDVPRGSLLDRLTRNKPGIWGNKAFYVGLAVVYVVLLVLFFRLLFQLARQSDTD